MNLRCGFARAGGTAGLLAAAVLADELGYLPLALQQAAGYLRQTRLPVSVYLDRLRAQPAEVLNTIAEGDQAERAVAQVWLLTLDRLREVRPAAIDLLRIWRATHPTTCRVDLGWICRSGRCCGPGAVGVGVVQPSHAHTDGSQHSPTPPGGGPDQRRRRPRRTTRTSTATYPSRCGSRSLTARWLCSTKPVHRATHQTNLTPGRSGRGFATRRSDRPSHFRRNRRSGLRVPAGPARDLSTRRPGTVRPYRRKRGRWRSVRRRCRRGTPKSRSGWTIWRGH